MGDLDRQERRSHARAASFNYTPLIVIAAIVAALAIGAFAVYNSSLFVIQDVSVVGVEHLTSSDMAALADVDQGTTLLRVDADGIRNRLLSNSWVESVSVNRVFPNTLQLVVTERTIKAVVSVTSKDAQSTEKWAIASDGMWLMSIPDQNTDAGKKISQKVYDDAASVLQITDVPYGTTPEIGSYCTDSNVNNALNIVAGLTTSLSTQVKSVAATDAESTTITLQNGVEIVFGTADNIREKERVCLQIMEQNPGTVAYINVRVVASPTWRAL